MGLVMTEAELAQYRYRWIPGYEGRYAATEYGVTQSQIHNIVTGKSWSY